jgi:hypothetical protein
MYEPRVTYIGEKQRRASDEIAGTHYHSMLFKCVAHSLRCSKFHYRHELGGVGGGCG